MNFKLESFIAVRYLKSNRKEGFISVSSFFSFIGITIGVATLIVVMSVMNGFRSELISKIIGVNGHAIIFLKKTENINNINILKEKVENLDNVQFVSKELESQAMLSTKKNSSGVVIKGIDKVDLYERASIQENIIEGNIDQFEGKSLIIGIRLAEYLDLRINSNVNLLTSSFENTPFGNLPINDNFRIVGIFDVGMYEYDRTVAFMPRNAAVNLNNSTKLVSQLEVFFNDGEKVDETTLNIIKILGNEGKVFNWKSIHRELFSALKLEKKVMFLILFLIIFVAAFNLISSIIMIVKDKEKGIGILRTLGATKYQILRIFIMVGSFVGFLGTVLGSLIGLIISKNIASIQLFLETLFNSKLFSPKIYFFSSIPSQISYNEVAYIIFISFFLSILSTIYPAWKATKIQPANILRHE